MTPKQKVLKHYPDAISYAWTGPEWCVYTKPAEGFSLNGVAKSAAGAWAQAWKRISEDKRIDPDGQLPGIFQFCEPGKPGAKRPRGRG